jgi:hypothetical protein
MSEKKKSASAGGAAAGAQRKKQRPPPLQTMDSGMVADPNSVAAAQFALPTMRNMFVPQQQIVVTPAAQPWEVQEQTQLDRLHRLMCFPNESLLNKSIKIAAHLNAKTVRDVACRLRIMEENTSLAFQNRQQDEVDQFLNRGDAILAELQSIPSRDRTDDQNNRLNNLMREFITNTRTCRSQLDGRGLKIPVQFVTVPELPELTRSDKSTSSSKS